MTSITIPPAANPKSGIVRLRLPLVTLATAGVLVAIGYWPTHALAGTAGVHALLAAGVVVLAGGWAGLIPPLVALRRGPRHQLNGLLGGLGVRFAVTLGLTAAAALSGIFALKPLVLWVAIGQFVVLAVDTVGLVGVQRESARTSA